MSNTPVAVSVSKALSPLARPGRFLARSTSHSVAARSDCTNIPTRLERRGGGSGGRDHSGKRLFRPWFTAVRRPGSAKFAAKPPAGSQGLQSMKPRLAICLTNAYSENERGRSHLGLPYHVADVR